MNEHSSFLTIPEAAARVRLAPPTIRRAIARGHLAAVRPGGVRRVLIPAQALEAFINGGPSGTAVRLIEESSRYTRGADGAAAIADDMPPATREIVLLLEHANARRDAGLALPCPCGECDRHRGAERCTSSPDGRTLIVEPA